MRQIWGMLSTFLILLNICIVVLGQDNSGYSDDNSGHQDAFKDGQLANVLSGLLHQNEESQNDPNRILCLFRGKNKCNGKKKQQHKGHSQTSQDTKYGNVAEGNQPLQSPPVQQQQYGLAPLQNQAYGPPTQNLNTAYGPTNVPSHPQQIQNQGYGPAPPPHPQKQQQQPPPKSYSFSISFGDRLRPRKKQRPQQPFNNRPPLPEMRPFPPLPLPLPSQQPSSSYFPQPQQLQQQIQPILPQPNNFNFNMQPQHHQFLNLPLPPTNLQPYVPTHFQTPLPSIQPQTNNFQTQQSLNPQTNYFPQNNNNGFVPMPFTTPMASQYGVPNQYVQPQLQYFNPLDQLNYRPESQPQQQPEYQQRDQNFVYVYGPPETGYEEKQAQPIRVSPSQKSETRYQVVFIRAPSPPPEPQLEIQLPPQDEHKTLVYVLVKKPLSSSSAADIKFIKPPTTTPAPPEVFFVKYKNNGGGAVLPSTSDPNAGSYNTIDDDSNNNFQEGQQQQQQQYQQQQNFEQYSENQGGYQEVFTSRSNKMILPSTSSDFAMERDSNFEPSSQSHYTSPGSRPWSSME